MAAGKARARDAKARAFKSWSEVRSVYFPQEEARRLAESDPFRFGAGLAEGSIASVFQRELAKGKGTREK
jgi:hypothetical protein